MRITTVGHKNLQDLIIEGVIPSNLKLVGTLPDTYTINLIHDGLRTVIVASETISGAMAYAVAKGDYAAPGKKRILNPGDKAFIKRNYPIIRQPAFSLLLSLWLQTKKEV